jgi:hypothetical protein
MRGLSAWAFRDLAPRPGLQQLWLDTVSPAGVDNHVITRADIESVAATVSRRSVTSHKIVSCYSPGQDRQVHRQPGPLEHLKDLRINVSANALLPLVLMLGSLMSLAVNVQLHVDPSEISALVFPALAKLRCLHHLEVMLPDEALIAPGDLCALQHLVQLHELRVFWGTGSSISDKHIEALLRPLGKLRLLLLHWVVSNLSHGLLQVIADTSSGLQSLELAGTQRLALLLDDVFNPPVFPVLECLEL